MPVFRRSSGDNSSSRGAFQIRTSTHNPHGFPCARDDSSRPYPTAAELYSRSDCHDNDQDPFHDVGLADFFTAHSRTARRKLARLRTSEFMSGLLSRGIQPQFDRREPPSEVLQASIAYAASCSVAVLEETSICYERQDELMSNVDINRDRIEEVDQALRERVRFLENEVADERRHRREATRECAELRTLVDGLIQQVGDLRDDFTRHRVLSRRAVPLATGHMSAAPGRFAPIPVPSFGRLVPIEEPIPDLAEDLPTTSSSGSSIRWSGSSGGGDSQSLRSQPIVVEDGEVRDFAAEEEGQAEEDGEAERLHQEILRARADPAPEYRPRSPNLPGFDEL
jgi:hypothetical protein